MAGWNRRRNRIVGDATVAKGDLGRRRTLVAKAMGGVEGGGVELCVWGGRGGAEEE